jgi:tyrosyl-tRNA synthetase
MLSTPDDSVERMLKLFTFLPLPEIRSVMVAQQEDESLRIAQHRLAYEFLSLAHGQKVAQEAADLHKARSSQRRSIDLGQVSNATMTLTDQDLAALSFPQLFKLAKLVDTNAQGARLVAAKGAYVGMATAEADVLIWHPVSSVQKGEALQHVAWKGDQGVLLLRIGKWKVVHMLIQRTTS